MNQSITKIFESTKIPIIAVVLNRFKTFQYKTIDTINQKNCNESNRDYSNV